MRNCLPNPLARHDGPLAAAPAPSGSAFLSQSSPPCRQGGRFGSLYEESRLREKSADDIERRTEDLPEITRSDALDEQPLWTAFQIQVQFEADLTAMGLS